MCIVANRVRSTFSTLCKSVCNLLYVYRNSVRVTFSMFNLLKKHAGPCTPRRCGCQVIDRN
jgi:hypothetical protein